MRGKPLRATPSAPCRASKDTHHFLGHYQPIFVDDEDRRALLAVVGLGLARFDAQALAFCLMGNNYHFVLHTRRADQSSLMRHMNDVYTQAFNRRHGKVGHLFQGRFKAILVDRYAYLVS